MDTLIFVDGHVHVHSCFEPDVFLRSAVSNFQSAATAAKAPALAPGVLLLVEPPDRHVFRDWKAGRGATLPGGWHTTATDERTSLGLERSPDESLVLIAGRQIPTSDGLEVLAVACNIDLQSSIGFRETIAAVRAADGIPIIPWGFGKWWGRRGRLVTEAIESGPRPLFLGDNGGRPQLAVAPPHFLAARERGVFTLAGSDPLPFRRQQTRAGGYGFILAGPMNWFRPAASVTALLASLSSQPKTFGRRERLIPFARNQIAMQIHKRRRSGRSRRA